MRRLRNETVLIAVGCAALFPGFAATARGADANAAQPPNIVLILADDLGWTDIGCFGSDFYQTPHIDGLAAQGMKLTQSYSACNVCSPTRASIMTGKYPARLHLTDYIPGGKDRGLRSPKWTRQLPVEEITIAELLARQGYACGHFGKWHLSEDKEYRPNRPGDPGSQGFKDVLAVDKPSPAAAPESDAHHAREITDRSIAFMTKNKDLPFFCYVAHSLVHRPVIARPKLLRLYEERLRPGLRHNSAAYAAMVHELDDSVGRIAAAIDELGLSERTLFLFTSDNGGFLGDDEDNGTSNAPLRAGKGTNYEGGVRVPTIVRWPGVVKPATECREPVISNDLFPTLLEAAGVSEQEIPAEATSDSVSFVSLLRNPGGRLDREALYWHYPHYHAFGATPHGAVRMGDWKLIEFYEDMHVELYNIEEDVGEQHDLAAAQPGVVARLQDRLHRWREKVGAQMPTR